MTVRVVTDSSTDLPRSLIEALGVTVVPLTVNFGAERLRDGVDIDHETFYRRLESSEVFPSTSQITPAEFSEAYSSVDPGSDIVSIHAAEDQWVIYVRELSRYCRSSCAADSAPLYPHPAVQVRVNGAVDL